MPNSRCTVPGSGGTDGARAPGANRPTGRSAALSARARQLTPQARERGGCELSRKIAGMRLGRSRVRAGVIVLAVATTALCAAAGVAFGQAQTGTPTATTDVTGGATSSGATDTAAGSSGSTGGGGGGSMRLVGEAAHPGKAFIYGDHRITYSFTVDGDRSKDLKIQAVRRKNWKTVNVWRRNNVRPGTYRVHWNGITRKGRTAN